MTSRPRPADHPSAEGRVRTWRLTAAVTSSRAAAITSDYPAPVGRVWDSFAEEQQKLAWWGGGDAVEPREWRFDFRTGGRDIAEGKFHNGPLSRYKATYTDIVEHNRIVTTYDMWLDGVHMSTSVASLEFEPIDEGTRFTHVEHGVFFDQFRADGPDREKGTRGIPRVMHGSAAGPQTEELAGVLLVPVDSQRRDGGAVQNEWAFSYDEEDESWVATREPPVDDNLIAAVETVTDAFSESWQLQDAMSQWKEHPLDLVSVFIKELDADTVELRDKYGQFRNVEMIRVELKSALHSLLHAMNEREAAQRRAGITPNEWTITKYYGPYLDDIPE